MRGFLIIFVFCITATVCFGTTCINWKGLSDQEFRKLLDLNEAIFSGEVIGFEPPIDSTQCIKIRVMRIWKGKVGSQVELLYQGASEPFEREIGGIGTQRVFYAGVQPNGILQATYCGLHGPQTTLVDERMKTYFGEGKVIEQPAVVAVEQTPSFFSRMWEWLTSIFKST